jgi:hypothetical protein
MGITGQFLGFWVRQIIIVNGDAILVFLVRVEEDLSWELERRFLPRTGFVRVRFL